MSKILCSTGALIGRPNGRNFRLLETLTPALSCDGYEFMMYDTWYGEVCDILCLLDRLGLYAPVMHCEKSIGEKISLGGDGTAEACRLFDINCKMAKELGAEKLVLHLWNGRTSDAHFERNLAAYPRLHDIAERHGIDLLVENVVCNASDPMTHLCELHGAYPDVHFVFDTKMAAFHSQLELLYSDEYAWLWQGGHIRHYHVNDYGGTHRDWQNLSTLPIGSGHVDFVRFFEFIKKTGYSDTFTVESTAFDASGEVDTDMLNRQFEYLRGIV